MIRTVIAMAEDQLRESVERILLRSGIEIRTSCRSGKEAIRAVRRMDGGIIICSARLTDMTADDLAENLDGSALLLILSHPSESHLAKQDGLFRLQIPVRSGELIGCVRILLQLDEQRAEALIPKRSTEDKAIIERAKQMLMKKNDMTEEEAHRFIQKRSMETSTPMQEISEMILTALN